MGRFTKEELITVSSKQKNIYSEEQLLMLRALFLTINYSSDQQTFCICDLDSEIDLLSPYFRAENYPIYEGGEKSFTLGIEKKRKFLWFFPYSDVEIVGKIEWEFNQDQFKKISVTLQPLCKPLRPEADLLEKFLSEKFKCLVA